MKADPEYVVIELKRRSDDKQDVFSTNIVYNNHPLIDEHKAIGFGDAEWEMSAAAATRHALSNVKAVLVEAFKQAKRKGIIDPLTTFDEL